MEENIIWHEYAKEKPPLANKYLTVSQSIDAGRYKNDIEIHFAYKGIFDSNSYVVLFWAELPKSPLNL